jgi:hypothetical protein
VIGDNAGNIFIADANDNRLLRFDNGATEKPMAPMQMLCWDKLILMQT